MKKVKLELNIKEAFALWKLTTRSPRISSSLRYKLFRLLTTEERNILLKKWEQSDLIPYLSLTSPAPFKG